MSGSRKLRTQKEALLRVGQLTLDEIDRWVTRNGTEAPQHLTPMECKLLKTFMAHPGEVLTRAFLMKRVWDTDYLEDTRTLYVHVRWLRQKVEEHPDRPQLITTVRGKGYCFNVPEETAGDRRA